MASFLLDENLGRRVAEALRSAGLSARTVREAGLRGQPDTGVLDRGSLVVVSPVVLRIRRQRP